MGRTSHPSHVLLFVFFFNTILFLIKKKLLFLNNSEYASNLFILRINRGPYRPYGTYFISIHPFGPLLLQLLRALLSKGLERKLLPSWVLPAVGSCKLNFDGCG